jgi:hypothetical protein
MGDDTMQEILELKELFKNEQKWMDALATVESVSHNRFREGQHLDIRIVGPGCSISLLELNEFRALVKIAVGKRS